MGRYQYLVGGFLPPNGWLPSSIMRDMRGLIPSQDRLEPHRIRVEWRNLVIGACLVIQSPAQLREKQFLEIQIVRVLDGA